MVALHVHPASGESGTIWLQFPRSGLLVEVQGEASRLRTKPEGDYFELDHAEAHGLGLTPADFTDGVAICHDEDDVIGWRCTSVAIELHDVEGGEHLLTSAVDARRWLD